ncbi:hypothetical protein AB0E25_41155 [Streptomyces bobili]
MTRPSQPVDGLRPLRDPDAVDLDDDDDGHDEGDRYEGLLRPS